MKEQDTGAQVYTEDDLAAAKVVRKVFIARGQHFSISGEHFSVHATRASAVLSALKSLNILRKDLGMTPATIFHDNTVKATIRKARELHDDDGQCDVWIEEHKVEP